MKPDRHYTIINPDPTFENNLMVFGFMCGPGWYPLIYELLDKLQDIVDEQKLDIEVVEIKEKYGGLRVYLSSYTDEIEALTEEYKERSYTICENCGDPGSLRVIRGWYQTLCDECAEKRINRNP